MLFEGRQGKARHWDAVGFSTQSEAALQCCTFTGVYSSNATFLRAVDDNMRELHSCVYCPPQEMPPWCRARGVVYTHHVQVFTVETQATVRKRLAKERTPSKVHAVAPGPEVSPAGQAVQGGVPVLLKELPGQVPVDECTGMVWTVKQTLQSVVFECRGQQAQNQP